MPAVASPVAARGIGGRNCAVGESPHVVARRRIGTPAQEDAAGDPRGVAVVNKSTREISGDHVRPSGLVPVGRPVHRQDQLKCSRRPSDGKRGAVQFPTPWAPVRSRSMPAPIDVLIRRPVQAGSTTATGRRRSLTDGSVSVRGTRSPRSDGYRPARRPSRGGACRSQRAGASRWKPHPQQR